MFNMSYADVSYYITQYNGELDTPIKALRQASRHIDILTYNRIVGKGFNNLTPYQQETIKEVCCKLADFETENADMIECVLQSYSINGVSMTFGSSWNLVVQNGVAIKRDLFRQLESTGLCCAVLR